MCSKKYTKCEIILDGFETSPHCEHGPTALFSRGDHKFYACSAYRSRQLCSFYLDFDSSRRGLQKSKRKVKMAEVTDTEGGEPEDNKGQAQYFFSETTLQYLLEFLKATQAQNILCIGTPTVHQQFAGASYFLDIDTKFSSVPSFSRYNMCNHHFFTNNSEYLNHLEQSNDLVVICDPPFGARLELLFNTFNLIEKEWRRIHTNQGKLDIILINPYFTEGKILKLNSALAMSDYRVEYASHKKFKKGDKSPIRLFTTLDLSQLVLPQPDYKFCAICQKYVFSNSKHCRICLTCDSRDGKNYYHCSSCGKCFKETWTHCKSCTKCHLPNSEKYCDIKPNLAKSTKRKK